MIKPLIWVANLIHSLAEEGVTHAVISPGSRSTPLTIAASLHPNIQTHVVLDERSAAFLALGIGKATGIPSILICTSGTAAANYFPAVIEARQSGVPMVLLTADRPPFERGTGSSQTIDQIKLYGEYSLFFHEAGEPRSGLSDLMRLRSAGKQALRSAIRAGGASHINLPFRKPLEPSAEEIKTVTELIYKSSKNLMKTDSDTTPPLIRQLSHQVRALLSASERPLIISGPSQPHHTLHSLLKSLEVMLQAPLIAEPGSGIGGTESTVQRYEQFLRNKEIIKKLKPDLIIRFADQPYTRSLSDLLHEWRDLPLIHFSARSSAQDPAFSVTAEQQIDPAETVDLSFLKPTESNHWLKQWMQLDSEYQKRLQNSLDSVESLTDGHLFRHLDEVFPESWSRMISNSFPVRDTALFGKNLRRQFVNRGAAGIDGIISTGLGIHIASESPTLVVTGDLAFFHDSNALLSMRESKHPFVVVVVNNGGGTIFRMLPLNRPGSPLAGSKTFNHYFETPQNVDIGKLAAAHQIPFMRISTRSDLRSLKPDQMKGLMIAECVTDADESMKLRNQLWES